MKQLIAILLATMLLAVCLTACGRRDNYGQDDNATNNQTTDTNQTTPGSDAILGNDTSGSVEERPNESVNNAASDGEIGVSYEQMLRNGHVHDTDGLLKDGENSTSNLMGDAENAARDLARSAKNGVESLMR